MKKKEFFHFFKILFTMDQGDQRDRLFLLSGKVAKLVFIYQTLSPQERCHLIPIFKWSKAGLNLSLSFSYTGCLTKVEEPSLLCCLLIYIYIYIYKVYSDINGFKYCTSTGHWPSG